MFISSVLAAYETTWLAKRKNNRTFQKPVKTCKYSIFSLLLYISIFTVSFVHSLILSFYKYLCLSSSMYSYIHIFIDLPSIYFTIEPISYGETVSQFITKESGFLSYPTSSAVIVWAKSVTIDASENEIWEVEVSKVF